MESTRWAQAGVYKRKSCRRVTIGSKRLDLAILGSGAKLNSRVTMMLNFYRLATNH